MNAILSLSTAIGATILFVLAILSLAGIGYGLFLLASGAWESIGIVRRMRAFHMGASHAFFGGEVADNPYRVAMERESWDYGWHAEAYRREINGQSRTGRGE